MADELDFDLESLDTDIENQNKVEKRIKDLSGKAKSAYEERDEALKKAEQAEKKATFLEGFGDIQSKYPQAAEFKEDIQKKVLEDGYSPKAAALEVLDDAGKLTPEKEEKPAETPEPEATQQVPQSSPTGGSASTPLPVDKGVEDMTKEEKRAALQELSDSGELSKLFKHS